MEERANRRRAAVAGILLGIGLGGFFDGILLHQILRWHNMFSTVLPPTTMEAMHTNMLGDGLFHAFVWLVTLAGVLLLWSAARHPVALPPAGWLVGLLFAGWGLFNLVEGTIDHQILGIHHVRGYGPDPVWDIGFLLSGAVFVLFGWVLVRAARD